MNQRICLFTTKTFRIYSFTNFQKHETILLNYSYYDVENIFWTIISLFTLKKHICALLNHQEA